MRKRTLLSMGLALMLGMTTLATPVWATSWGHEARGKHYGHGGHGKHYGKKHARRDAAPHRGHGYYGHRDWRPGRHWRQRLRRQHRRYRQHLRNHYLPYYEHHRPGYHRGGHYGYGYGDRHAYGDRSGLTIIYRGDAY